MGPAWGSRGGAEAGHLTLGLCPVPAGGIQEAAQSFLGLGWLIGPPVPYHLWKAGAGGPGISVTLAKRNQTPGAGAVTRLPRGGVSGEERTRCGISGMHLFPEEISPRLLVPALGPHPEVAHVQADGVDHRGTVGRGWTQAPAAPTAFLLLDSHPSPTTTFC